MTLDIRSEEAYALALEEYDRLWGSEPGTPEAQRLLDLAGQIEAYESERYPMELPDPIEAIKFNVDRLDLTHADLAESLGASVNVSYILERRVPLTAGMIERLSKLLDIPEDILSQG